MSLRDRQSTPSFAVPILPTPAAPNPLHARAAQVLHDGDAELDRIADRTASQNSRQFLRDTVNQDGQ